MNKTQDAKMPQASIGGWRILELVTSSDIYSLLIANAPNINKYNLEKSTLLQENCNCYSLSV
jgi:hypothetical protein